MLTRIDDLIKNSAVAGEEITILNPASDEKIHAAESMLGVVFSPSYKEYLKKYGAMEVGTCSFAGLTESEAGSIGDVVAFTKYARKSFGLPARYIALNFEDGDAFLCIDTERKDINDESSIVLINPTDGKQMGGVVATSFSDYLVEFLNGYLLDD